jgi:arginase family enzyme
MPSGTDGIIKKIRETVGDGPVYLSIDVRVAVAFAICLMLINYT